MFLDLRLIVRRHIRHPIVLGFAVAIFLPALLLLVFGVNSFRRDRAAADREVRDRVDRAADEVAAALERIVAEWERALQHAAATDFLDPERLPAPIARAVSEAGLGALVLLDAGSVRIIPEKELLYDVRPAPVEPPVEEPLISGLAEAETAELRDKDYHRASELYRRLLATADAAVRPLVTHRLARVYRKQGRIADAITMYRRLAGQPSAWGDDLPLELVARYEICDMQALDGAGSDFAAGAAGPLSRPGRRALAA